MYADLSLTLPRLVGISGWDPIDIFGDPHQDIGTGVVNSVICLERQSYTVFAKPFYITSYVDICRVCMSNKTVSRQGAAYWVTIRLGSDLLYSGEVKWDRVDKWGGRPSEQRE